jgi:hypothetical protein
VPLDPPQPLTKSVIIAIAAHAIAEEIGLKRATERSEKPANIIHLTRLGARIQELVSEATLSAAASYRREAIVLYEGEPITHYAATCFLPAAVGRSRGAFGKLAVAQRSKALSVSGVSGSGSFFALTVPTLRASSRLDAAFSCASTGGTGPPAEIAAIASGSMANHLAHADRS